MAMSVVYTNFNGRIVKENRAGVERYYAPDTLGSTALLLDSTGTVTDTFTYWPYGELRSHTGPSTTPFTFIGTLGYYFHLAANWFYVRARFYQQVLGRWITTDPLWPGALAYEYGASSPVQFIDATGLIHCIFSPTNTRERCGRLKCYADPGDVYPCTVAGGAITVPCQATPGQQILNCEACNNALSPSSPPTLDGGNGYAPSGTYPLRPPRWNDKPVRQSEIPSEGPCFVPIPLPTRNAVGIHGGRGNCHHQTLGCIRTGDDCATSLGELLGYWNRGGSGTITILPPPNRR